MDDEADNCSEPAPSRRPMESKVITRDESTILHIESVVNTELGTAINAEQDELNESPKSDSLSSAQASNKTDNDSGMFSKTEEMEIRNEENSADVPVTSASGTSDDEKEFIGDLDNGGLDVACTVTVEKGRTLPISNSNTNSMEGAVVGSSSDPSVVTSSSNIHRRFHRTRARNYRHNSSACELSPERGTDVAITQVLNEDRINLTASTSRGIYIDGAATNFQNAGENSHELSDVHSNDYEGHDGNIADDVNNENENNENDYDENFANNNEENESDYDDVNDDEDDDSSDDDDISIRDYNDEANHAEDTEALKEVLNKPKPDYTWNSVYELMRREHGLTRNGERSLKNGMSYGFGMRFYSSRQVIERMELSFCLHKHHGCVNCLNFNRSGDILCSGSDDTSIIVWNWAQDKVKHEFKSGHTENIFQTKFVDSDGSLDIVSASRDGQVRRSIIPPSGGKIKSSCLYKHNDSVHKLVICPQSVHEIFSVGEDGYIRHKDLRTDENASEMLKVVTARNKNRKVRLFGISHHPFAPEICVCGCDNLVRVYDTRNMGKVVHEMCPEQLVDTPIPQVTCCVYNNTGSEILATYSDEHIYLFNNKVYKMGEYLHRYKGHYNHKTIKGVNFFGPNSEYIVSGSDCGNIFFWDKNTEAILNFIWRGDTMGVVNCLEPHPSIPVLATSGLDHDIKIWTPSNENYPPDMSKLEFYVKRNLRRTVTDETATFDDRQFHYFMQTLLRRQQSALDQSSDENDDSSSNIIDAQVWSSSSSENEYPYLEGLHCRTQ